MEGIHIFRKSLLVLLVGLACFIFFGGIIIGAVHLGIPLGLARFWGSVGGLGAFPVSAGRALSWYERTFENREEHRRNLSQEIQALSPPTPERTLTQDEIKQFKNAISDEKDLSKKREYQDTFDKYENFISDVCPISQSSMTELTWPLTIEHKNELPHHAKTYEKEEIARWIQQQGNDAKEPVKNYPLLDPNIRFYSGFPQWVKNFVSLVVNFIRQKPETKIINDVMPSSTPIIPFNSKKEIALKRQSYYNTIFSKNNEIELNTNHEKRLKI